MLVIGQIVKVYRKRPPDGIIHVFDDHNQVGKDLPFVVSGSLPVWVRRGIRVRAAGNVVVRNRKEILEVANLKTHTSGMSPALTRKGVEVLLEKGLPGRSLEGELMKLGEERDKAVIEPQLKARQALSEEKACELTQVAALQELFDAAGFNWGYVEAYLVYDFLEGRAKRYGMTVCDLLRKNPWVLAQVDGPQFGWKVAEALAIHLGASRGMQSVLGRALALAWADARRGNAYSAFARIWAGTTGERWAAGLGNMKSKEFAVSLAARGAKNPLGNLVPDSKHAADVTAGRLTYLKGFYPNADSAELAKRADREGHAVYLARAFFSEKQAAEILARLAGAGHDYRSRVKVDPSLDADQKAAVLAALSHGVSVWTGAAGSGKTYALKSLVRSLLDAGLAPLVLAPSAVAAARAVENVKTPSGDPFARYGTIHRIAGISKDEDDLAYSEPVQPDAKLHADVVIVDEMGMCDLPAFAHLLSCIEPGVHLVLCGDPEQLPPIGPAGHFHQMVRDPLPGIPVCGFGGVHRGVGPIRSLAYAVRQGNFPTAGFAGVFQPGGAPLTLIDAPLTRAAQVLVDIVSACRGAGMSPGGFLALAFRRQSQAGGAPGTEVLNQKLRDAWGMPGPVVCGYAVGDPVIAVKNDYEDKRSVSLRAHPQRRGDVYNGMSGVIVALRRGKDLVVRWNGLGGQPFDAPYTLEEAPLWIEPAYALTVHKAQGGEAPIVAVVASPQMDRRAFYTALTRARGQCVLVGPPEEWERIAKEKSPDPLTKFGERYRAEFGQPGQAAAVGPRIVIV